MKVENKENMKTTVVKSLLSMAVVLMTGHNTMAQQTETQSSKGKVVIETFTHFGASLPEKGAMGAEFNLERAYLGYEYQMNDNWSAKVVYDMGKGDDTKLQRSGYVKNAFVSYHKGALRLNAGLTGTKAFNEQEKQWSYRYVYKNIMDDRKWASSADLGLVAELKATDWMNVDLSMMNGEGYKMVQLDNQFQYGLGLTFKPVKGLQLRVYMDAKTAMDTATQKSLAFSGGYKSDIISFGAEYNMMWNQGDSEGHNLNAFSVYATGHLNKAIDIFARYDNGSSASDANDGWRYGHNGQTTILGMQWKINKMVCLAPNFRATFDDNENITTAYAFLSMKVKL